MQYPKDQLPSLVDVQDGHRHRLRRRTDRRVHREVGVGLEGTAELLRPRRPALLGTCERSARRSFSRFGWRPTRTAQQSARRDRPVRAEAPPVQPRRGSTCRCRRSLDAGAAPGRSFARRTSSRTASCRSCCRTGSRRTCTTARISGRAAAGSTMSRRRSSGTCSSATSRSRRRIASRATSASRAENLGRFERYEDAQAAVARPYQPPLPARRHARRQYYIVVARGRGAVDVRPRRGRALAARRAAACGSRKAKPRARRLGAASPRWRRGCSAERSGRYEQRTETFRVERQSGLGDRSWQLVAACWSLAEIQNPRDASRASSIPRVSVRRVQHQRPATQLAVTSPIAVMLCWSAPAPRSGAGPRRRRTGGCTGPGSA